MSSCAAVTPVRRGAQVPRWMPLSIMNGGGAANTLVRSLDSGWGRALFSNTIIRSISTSLYQVTTPHPPSSAILCACC